MAIFEVEDEVHAEGFGLYETYEQALARIKEIYDLPWDMEPYRPPCMSWKTCEREYQIVEWDNSEEKWKKISRIYLLYVSANCKEWKNERIDTDD